MVADAYPARSVGLPVFGFTVPARWPPARRWRCGLQPAAVGELGHLRPERFQLPAHRHLKAQLLADGPDLHRAVGSPHYSQDLAVVSGQRGLIARPAAVRDQQNRPSRHPGRRRGDGRGSLRHSPVLFGQPVAGPARRSRTPPARPGHPPAAWPTPRRACPVHPASRDPLQLQHPHALPALSRHRPGQGP